MLPEGFTWHDSADGERLSFGQRTVAFVTRLDAGACRVTTNPGTLHTKHVFFASYATGTRYVEAWARKWEAKIREGGTQAAGLYPAGTMRTPDRPVPSSHPRRRHR